MSRSTLGPALIILALLVTSCVAPGAALRGSAVAAGAGGCFEPPPPPVAAKARRAELEGCTGTPEPPLARSKIFHQLRYHQRMPATKAELLASVRAHAELTHDEVAFIADRLPERRFASAREVYAVLFPSAEPAVMARLAPVLVASR